MKSYPFSEVIKDITAKFKKIKASEYLNEGHLKIIDQGKSEVAGYTNDLSLVNSQLLPVIVFGDHTRAFKYHDSPIALGADGAKALLVNTDLAYSKYIYYYLRSIKIKSAGYSRHFKFLKEIKIPIPTDKEGPNLNDQKRIVNLLGKVERLINERKKNIQQLDDLLESVFLDMFGDPVRNQKNHKISTIDPFVSHLTSGGRGWAKYYSESGKRFIRSLDVQMNYIGSDDIAFVEPPSNKETERTRVQEGDILLTITGSKIGRVCVVPKGFEEAYVSQHVAIIRTEGINPVYLSYYLSLDNCGQRIIAKKQYGQAKPGLNLKQIREFEILEPKKRLQDIFENIFNKVENIKSQYQQSLGELKSLYGALSQKAFKGELDLSRVPLPSQNLNSTKNFNTDEQVENPVNKPENSILGFSQIDAASLNDSDLRKVQLSKWFCEWLEQYQKESYLNINHFWQSVHFTAQDYLDENDNPLEISLSDYDHIKSEVFDAIKSGVIDQTTNMIEVEVDGKQTIEPGNQILLKKITKRIHG